MLNLDLTTIVFEILNFVVLSLLLYRFLFQPVMRNVRQRAAEKEQLMRAMEAEQAEITRLRVELEARLEKVNEETDALFDQAVQQAKKERTELLQEAHAEAERILVAAHKEASRWQGHAVDQFHTDMVATILDISTEVIRQVVPQAAHDDMVEQLTDHIWQMGRSEMERVEAIRRFLADREPTVYIITARPLTIQQQGSLARTFAALADREVNLELETDPHMAAGLRVRLGDMIVENSIAKQLHALHEQVTRQVTQQANGEQPAAEAVSHA